MDQSSGLTVTAASHERIQILQKTDGKEIVFSPTSVEEVIPRTDADGQSFLQVNFLDGKKILITTNLVGFKPAGRPGLDMNKLPKVVTTPDLASVVEAIQECLSGEVQAGDEFDVLKKVYEAVLKGGETVGFALTSERAWLSRITQTNHKLSA